MRPRFLSKYWSMCHKTPLSCWSKYWIVQLTPRHLKTKDQKSVILASPSRGDHVQWHLETTDWSSCHSEGLQVTEDSRSGLCRLPQRPKNRPHSGSSGPCGVSHPGIRSLSASLRGPTSSSRHQGTKRPNNIQGKGNCLQQNVSQKGLTFHILKWTKMLINRSIILAPVSLRCRSRDCKTIMVLTHTHIYTYTHRVVSMQRLSRQTISYSELCTTPHPPNLSPYPVLTNPVLFHEDGPGLVRS